MKKRNSLAKEEHYDSSVTSVSEHEPRLSNRADITGEVMKESYITRFENIKTKQGVRVNSDAWLLDANSANVASICHNLKNLDVNTADYEAQKTSLKAQLPLYAFCGFNNTNNRGEEFISNGNVIIDLDRLDEDTLQDYISLIMKWNVVTKGEKLLLVHRTPSFRGLRVVFRGDCQLTMVENQHQFAKEVGLPLEAIDKQVKDIKRISYAVPMDYIFFYHEDLFHGKGAALAVPSAENESYSATAETLNNKIKSLKTMSNENVSINKDLIDNYFEKHHEERCVGNRHNSDGKFGSTLKYYGVPENQVTASYEYYISLYKHSGKFYADDPSDTSEGIEVVLNNYLKNTTQAPETEFISTSTTECGVNNEVKVPYFADCNLEEIIKKHNDTAFIVDQLRDIRLPQTVWQTLQPIINDDSRTMFAAAALFSVYTTASTYLHDVSYAFAEGSRKEYIALNTLISAGFATGKRVLDDVVDLWSEHLRFQTKLFNDRYNEWLEREEARLNSITDDIEAEPEPINPTLFTSGGDLTAAGINRVLARGADRRLCLFVPEVDTVNKSKGGKFGITSDMMRNFFDSTDIEVIRAGNNQNKIGKNSADQILRVSGRMNYILCGTPEAMATFTPMADAENGTASRQILCAVPEVKYTVTPDDYPVEAIRAKGNIIKVSRLLSQMNGHVIINDLIALKKEWDVKWTSYAKASDDVAVDKLKRRAQVLAYRIALNNHIIEMAEKSITLEKGKWYKGKEEIPTPSISEDTKKLFLFSANYIMLQQVQRFGNVIREHSKNAISYDKYAVSITKGSAFDKLPNTFTYSDMREYYSNQNVSKNIVKRWKKKGLIRKEGNVFYKIQ